MAKSSTAKKRPAPRRKSVIGRTSKTSGVATREIKPKDLQKFVLVGDPQISPDGATVLFTRKHVGEKLQTVSNLWMAKTGEIICHPFSI